MRRTPTHGTPVLARPRSSHPAVLVVLALVATLAATLVISGDVAAQSVQSVQDTQGVQGDQDTGAIGADLVSPLGGTLSGPFFDGIGFFQNATNNPAIVNRNNAFFDTHLGSNGQACVTCHQPSQAYSVSVPFIQLQFATSLGQDPLFRLNDTADRPDADISTLAKRRKAFELFLELGIVRIGKTVPSTAQFAIVPQTTARFGTLPSVTDPQAPGTKTLSLFRRPLATTNTRFDSVVLWDGRQNIHNLRTQVQAAARTLHLAPNLKPEKADNIASYMTDVFTAQEQNFNTGSLSARGAKSGVENLKALATSASTPCVPMTDPQQANTFTPPVTPRSTGCVPPDPNGVNAFTLFSAWLNLPQTTEFRSTRMAVARGEKLFNAKNLLPLPPPATATCSGCHATGNIGNFPFVNPNNAAPGASLFFRLGLDSPDALAFVAKQDPRIQRFVERTADLPVYSLTARNGTPGCPGAGPLPDPRSGAPIPGTGLRSTDPGRALVTGDCADLGAFKPPILRGLQARAPFFHNGAAETLDDVVNFYDAIFGVGFTPQEHADLVAFLKAL